MLPKDPGKKAAQHGRGRLLVQGHAEVSIRHN